jgi:hypothetical protein
MLMKQLMALLAALVTYHNQSMLPNQHSMLLSCRHW